MKKPKKAKARAKRKSADDLAMTAVPSERAIGLAKSFIERAGSQRALHTPRIVNAIAEMIDGALRCTRADGHIEGAKLADAQRDVEIAHGAVNNYRARKFDPLVPCVVTGPAYAAMIRVLEKHGYGTHQMGEQAKKSWQVREAADGELLAERR